MYNLKSREMKNLVSILTVVLFITSYLGVKANIVDVTGESNTDMGKFKITELAPVMVKGEQVRAFELKYENSEHPVIVLLDENKKCKNYIVRAKNLEIKYVCKKDFFGARLVSGKFIEYDPAVNEYYLDKEEFKRQEILSTNGLDEKEALGIIASYFPQLIKDTRLLM